MDILRLLRTLRHVPPQALVWRLRARLLQRYYMSPLYDLKRVWEGEGLPLPSWCGVALLPGDKARGEHLATGTWLLANKAEALGLPPRSWLPKLQPLQVFELHYHEWLADLRAAERPDLARQLVGDWLTQFGHYHPVAWHPYPLSLRLAAWLTHGRWLLAEAEDDLKAAFTGALRVQVAHLRRNCEWDLGGNHLIKNLKALVMGAVALGDTPLLAWASQRLRAALQHQILPDGAHDERSPLYHAQVLQDMLELRATLRNTDLAPAALLQLLERLLPRMGEALACYTYPDGKLGLWNDSAETDAARLAFLVQESGATTPPNQLPHAGYVRLERKGMGLVLDAGRVGPDENPGHAHADTLAFELWLGTQRVVVNQGTLAYQHPQRNAWRGTAAHSTLGVQHHDSAEVWAEHRVGRRPRQVGFTLSPAPDGGDSVRAWHDGYRHLGLQHSRTLHLAEAGNSLHGTDELLGFTSSLRVWVRFHLHPSLTVRQENEQEALLILPDGRKLRFTCTEGGRLSLQPSRYAPQFNTLQESQQLAVRMVAPKLLWMLSVLK